jgi:anti-sigma regulatory factor (Ser/Thr protein kinase)
VPSEIWTEEASPEAVGRVRRAVGSWARRHGVPQPPVEDVELAVSEAVGNVVVHAYRDGDPGPVRLKADLDDVARRLDIVVSDEGVGMKPRPDSPGLGLGLPTIATLADRFEVAPSTDDGGTTICMCFSLP